MEPKKLRLMPSQKIKNLFVEEMHEYIDKLIDWNKAYNIKGSEFQHPDLGRWYWRLDWFVPVEETKTTNVKTKVCIKSTHIYIRDKTHLMLVLGKLEDDYPEVRWAGSEKPTQHIPFNGNDAPHMFYLSVDSEYKLRHGQGVNFRDGRNIDLTDHPQWQFVQMQPKEEPKYPWSVEEPATSWIRTSDGAVMPPKLSCRGLQVVSQPLFFPQRLSNEALKHLTGGEKDVIKELADKQLQKANAALRALGINE